MPTVMDPKVNEETKPEAAVPVTEPELFAAEVEMERRTSGIIPLLLIGGLILVVAGAIYYFVKGARDVLTVPTATTTVTKILAAQGPATIRFSTGTVVSNVNEKVNDPHYKLLTKAGILVTKPKGYNTLIVNITDTGDRLLSNINGVVKTKNPEGTTTYLVPLAGRKLLDVNKVTMVRPHIAQVDYTWQWEPNRLGQALDASGSLVKGFATWDRATLIKSYGVDFFSAGPTKANIVLMETSDGNWKPYTE